MNNNSENLTIGRLASAAGVNTETIRFYQRKGLMQEPERLFGSIRRYGKIDLARICFIKSAQRLGFSLEEVSELLRLEDGTHCEEARKLADHKLQNVRERLADLQQIEAALSQIVVLCDAKHGTVKCPLIASLQQT